MEKWYNYNDFKSPKSFDKLSKVIINELGSSNTEFFSFKEKIRPNRTRLIKDKLALLGHNKYGYKVYANGHSENLTQKNGGNFKNSEWLFDLHWYIDGKKPYTTLRMPLIMECEWQQKRKYDKVNSFSGIKYDFQKLIVSNAEFRVMIFRIIRTSELQELYEYFYDNISNYKSLEVNSKFLFIAYIDKEKTFYSSEIIKK